MTEALTTPLAVESWPLERVKPYPGNPRVNDGAVDAVAESIRRFGFRVPIVVDADGVIVAGHTRLKAARKLGLAEVPVHVAADLTPDQAKALRIADNKTGEIADWDFELLPIELSALQELDWDLTSLGFSDEELASQYPTMWDNRYEVAVGNNTDYPYVMTTMRLAEHMQTGTMTRNLPWLVEAHPEMFAEINTQLATEIGVKNGDYVRVKTARSPDGIRVKVDVTDRLLPIRVNGKDVHVVALPWHWGFKGLSTGPSANEITIDSVDVSANIPEYKTCLCNVVKD